MRFEYVLSQTSASAPCSYWTGKGVRPMLSRKTVMTFTILLAIVLLGVRINVGMLRTSDHRARFKINPIPALSGGGVVTDRLRYPASIETRRISSDRHAGGCDRRPRRSSLKRALNECRTTAACAIMLLCPRGHCESFSAFEW